MISLTELEEKVIKAGICVGCGACIGHCPYLEFKDGKVVATDRCLVENGRCTSVCPQYDTILNGIEGFDPNGGAKYLMARATSREVLEKAQYGGVVTTLLCFLLEKGAVSSAVVTTREGLGTLARSKGEVISCGGSRYTASGTLWALNLALKQKERALAVVGLPCQIKAVRLMERAGVLQGVEVFKIGLFCTWAMALRGYRKILREEGVILSPIKCDIPPPPANVFVIHAIDKTIELPLEKMRKAIQKGCLICPDMTATYADISVGAAEGIEGFNTVITRTEIGGRILEMCIGEGLLKWEELPYQNLSHLKEASRIKMDRANSRLKEGNFR